METLRASSAVESPNRTITTAACCMHQISHGTYWTKEENKKFESALAYFDEKTPDRWLKVASMIPGKSIHDVINQYMVLVADVTDIEAGLVPVPGYLASTLTMDHFQDHHHHRRGFDACRKRSRNYDLERRKGVPWTEEEHRRFLLGLVKHGRGDWRNISRNYVISKTPTQVASHAQKYYQRQLSSRKDKQRRPSIHDITTFDLTADNHTCDSFKLSDHKSSSNIKLLQVFSLLKKSNDEDDQQQLDLCMKYNNPIMVNTNSKIVMDWNDYSNDDYNKDPMVFGMLM